MDMFRPLFCNNVSVIPNFCFVFLSKFKAWQISIWKKNWFCVKFSTILIFHFKLFTKLNIAWTETAKKWQWWNIWHELKNNQNLINLKNQNGEKFDRNSKYDIIIMTKNFIQFQPFSCKLLFSILFLGLNLKLDRGSAN